MKKEFQYTQIDGMVSLEEATFELVRTAKAIQESHTFASAKRDKHMDAQIFHLRKASINTLMSLIERYIDQKSDNGGVGDDDAVVHVRFTMDHATWDKVRNRTWLDNINMATDDDSTKTPRLVEERSDYFIVKYASQTEFNESLNHFEGLVDYKVLTKE